MLNLLKLALDLISATQPPPRRTRFVAIAVGIAGVGLFGLVAAACLLTALLLFLLPIIGPVWAMATIGAFASFVATGFALLIRSASVAKAAPPPVAMPSALLTALLIGGLLGLAGHRQP